MIKFNWFYLNNILRMVLAHSQDFETNNELKTKVIAFLEEVMHDPELLTQERKAAANIIRYCSEPQVWLC